MLIYSKFGNSICSGLAVTAIKFDTTQS